MLDTEPTGGGSDTAATADSANSTSTSTSAEAPRRRRRATSSADAVAAPGAVAAPEADQAPDAAAGPAPRRRRAASRPAGEPAPAPAVEAPAEPATETPATAARTRSRRAAASTAEPSTAEPSTAPARTRSRRAAAGATAPVASETAELPVAEADGAAQADQAAAPSRGRRRRSTAVTFAPPVDDSPEPEVVVVVKAALPPIVTFQAPDLEAAPPSRTRRRATRAEAPAELPLDETAEEELADELLSDVTDAVALDDDATLTSEDIDEDDAHEDDAHEDADGEATSSASGRRRRRGRRGRGRGRPEDAEGGEPEAAEATDAAEPTDAQPDADGDEMESDGRGGTRRRRRRRSRGTSGEGAEASTDDPPNTVVRVRTPRQSSAGGAADDEGVRGLTGSTRLEAKRQRRRDGREQGKRRPPVLTEAEFLARREAVDRVMVVRQSGDRTQIAVLEDHVLVEHYVTKASATSYAGNVYLGKVQNVLPSMEAAFVDIGKGRNAVLYAGEVNYDASGIEGRAHRIEQALKPGQTIMVQVTKDPIGHKGSRLTSQISLPGRFLVYVPDGRVTGISRKLPDAERTRLKAILKRVMPEDAGVIVRTAAEGASEEDLERDVARLHAQWESIQAAAEKAGNSAPTLLYAEPDLVVRVIRDIFNEDFRQLIVQGGDEWEIVESYVNHLAPDLAPRLTHWVDIQDVFSAYRVDEQLTKALDRKVWLPSGGSLVIDRTEAMVVVDVNTGKFVGKGGNLEETVTKNNLEAAEEVVRQLRLRDLGGIIVIDFIDMVLESNRELVLRRLMECLGRDRTKHQVAEVTSLGLVQMTRKRVGQGLLESFSETCPTCQGRGFIVHMEHGAPTVPERGEDSSRDGSRDSSGGGQREGKSRTGKGGRERGSRAGAALASTVTVATVPDEAPRAAAALAIAKIAAATLHHASEAAPVDDHAADPADVVAVEVASTDVGAADVLPVEETGDGVDQGETAPAARSSRRRRGGSGRSGGAAGSNGSAEPAQEAATVSVPVAAVVAPAPAAGAPRRRRAASRPAGPAAVSPGSS